MTEPSKKKRAASKASSPVVVHDPVKVALSDANFDPYNPRVMPPEEMQALEQSVEEHGVVAKLVLQRVSDGGTPLVVIGGHQTITAIRNVCARKKQAPPEHAWAYVLDVDDRTARRLNVALNNISGDFDPLKLGSYLKLIHDAAPIVAADASGMGLGMGQVNELLKVGGVSVLPAPPPQRLTAFAKAPTLSIEFDTERERDDVRDLLATQIKGKQDLKAGTIVAAALGLNRSQT